MNELTEKWSERGYEEEVMKYLNMDIESLQNEDSKMMELSQEYFDTGIQSDNLGVVDMALAENNNYDNLSLLICEVINYKIDNGDILWETKF